MFLETREDVIVLPGRSLRQEARFPAEVEMILSAMEAGRAAHRRESEATDDGQAERRTEGRLPHRTRAELRLFRDRPGSPPWLLYVRDADPRGLGFITPHRLPLGYGGNVELIAFSGRSINVPCTLSRCREAVAGWYEGALGFNREQADFAR